MYNNFTFIEDNLINHLLIARKKDDIKSLFAWIDTKKITRHRLMKIFRKILKISSNNNK